MQPAAAATYWHGPIFSEYSITDGNGVERAMAILNASTGNGPLFIDLCRITASGWKR